MKLNALQVEHPTLAGATAALVDVSGH